VTGDEPGGLEVYERIWAMREAGYAFRHIATATGLSEWRCRSIWRSRVDAALDPEAIFYHRSLMLNALLPQINERFAEVELNDGRPCPRKIDKALRALDPAARLLAVG
jgi:hypothetical protein